MSTTSSARASVTAPLEDPPARQAGGAGGGASPVVRWARIAAVVGFFGAMWAGIAAYHLVAVDDEHVDYLRIEQDIYYIWQESVRVAAGENPYVRIHESDMRRNEKYATYFPGIYLLGAAAVQAGWDEFSEFIDWWRFPAMVGLMAMGALVFVLTRQGEEVVLPLLAAAFVWLNRWSLHNAIILHTDALALSFFLLSLWLWGRRQLKFAALLLGASLVIKHMAIFVAPLYLVWAWVEAPPDRRWRQTLTVFAWAAALPVLVCLPFLFDDPAALVKSILFSATRDRMAPHHSLDVRMGLEGFVARLPMFTLFFVVYFLAWRRRLTPYLAILLIFAVFVSFNNTLLAQYYVWMLTALVLPAAEVWRRVREGDRPALALAPAGAAER